MENENVSAPVNPVLPVDSLKKTYRASSLCGQIQMILLNIEGEFDVHDIVNKVKEECLKTQTDPGNTIRNARLVITAMLKDGVLVKVSRGRWKRV